MYTLKREEQEMVLNLLVEGNSIRGIERLTGIHRDTIGRLTARIGERCAGMLSEKMRGLHSAAIQVDEIWTYVQKKEQRLSEAEKHTEKGSQFVFVAIDADTKLIPHFCVGKRTEETAFDFSQELLRRVKGRFQMTTDAFYGYKVIETADFRSRVDYAILVKKFRRGVTNPDHESYSPRELVSLTPSIRCGEPNRALISTSYIERQNLTMRTQIRRFTRLTNAFSKKLDRLRGALNVYFFHYNFMREHRSLRMTPAMAAGVATRFLTWGEIL